MKKIFLALLSAAACTAQACEMPYAINEYDFKVFKKAGAWSSTSGLSDAKRDSVCKKLTRANAQIQINAMAIVSDRKSIGWTTLSVRDQHLPIATNIYTAVAT